MKQPCKPYINIVYINPFSPTFSSPSECHMLSLTKCPPSNYIQHHTTSWRNSSVDILWRTQSSEAVVLVSLAFSSNWPWKEIAPETWTVGSEKGLSDMQQWLKAYVKVQRRQPTELFTGDTFHHLEVNWTICNFLLSPEMQLLSQLVPVTSAGFTLLCS